MGRLPLQRSTAASLTRRNTAEKRPALRSGARLFPSAARFPGASSEPSQRCVGRLASAGLHRGDSCFDCAAVRHNTGHPRVPRRARTRRHVVHSRATPGRDWHSHGIGRRAREQGKIPSWGFRQVGRDAVHSGYRQQILADTSCVAVGCRERGGRPSTHRRWRTEADAITFPDLPLLWASFSSTASRSMGWFGLRGSVRSSLRERLQN